MRARKFTLLALTTVFVLGTVAAAHAQTFPISATVEFESGLWKLATITLKDTATVDWGDGTATNKGLLVDCRGFLNQTCDVYGSHKYADLGTFTITISYTTPGLFPAPASVSTTATVLPLGDFVILSIGDSVASGEGNPVVGRPRVFDGREGLPTFFAGLWDDPVSLYGPDDGCHRTLFSGPSLGAGILRATNPTSGVTFLHVACSGAKIGNIITQLKEARRALERARLDAGGLPGGDPINVDALLISAGGNNINDGFGSIIEACLKGDCSGMDLSGDIAALPGAYGALAAEINTPTEATRGTVSNVYITEYFDPTGNDAGEFPTIANCPLGGLFQNEWIFLYNEVVVPLNDAVATAASTHGWRHVGGIESAFRTHGYCASGANRWIVAAEESVVLQGDQLGSGHPNLPGQAIYRNGIVSTVIFFNPPETTPSARANGLPYAFGSWTPHDVIVTLTADNPIAQSGVGKTYFAVDNPACTPQALANCSIYSGSFVISTSGSHVVSFFSENQFNQLERMQTVLVRIDKDPPKLTCVPTPDVLWAPNGKLVPVSVNVTAVDDVSGPAPFFLSTLATSEGSVADDIQDFVTGATDTQGLLRARRFGTGPGRQYALTYQSADAVGNVASCTAVVTSPHDQGRGNDR